MGFSSLEIEECLSGKASEFLMRKKEVAASYHTLMIELLHTTLQSLENYNHESQR